MLKKPFFSSKGIEVDSTIETLEKSISQYKEEYALLISEAQSIKQDLTHVEAKVTVKA